MVFQPANVQLFKQKALQWASAFEVACCLDSNRFNDPRGKFDGLIAAGVKDELLVEHGRAFRQLEAFRVRNKGWLTGFLSYELKNETEKLTSSNPDRLAFPLLYFFSPQHLILIKDNEVEVLSDEAEAVFNQINQLSDQDPSGSTKALCLRARFTQQEYIDTVNHIKDHISRGDIYVTNFCQEFYAEEAVIEPLTVFQKLNAISPNPFSAFFRLKSKYVLCASPERFLAKRGDLLVSQPIKGTARRAADHEADQKVKATLRSHPKELQENVMIVDLVRNDLTRSAKPGTVKAEKLFEIQSFPQVHQMVSTVTCVLAENVSPVEALKNTFPMGSMTGAPKVSALQLMEQYERTKRGLYAGAMGYFGPDGDFDFNVVIRSILYNADHQYLSFQVGSAITHDAVAEKEYEECILKAKAILEVLDQTGSFPQS